MALGIESTAHTFGVGVITDDGKVLVNEKSVYKPPLGSGIRPREAAQYHLNNLSKIIKKVLKEIKISDLDIIGFSQGPGLPNCLQIGSSTARYLSLKHRNPLVGVNHCVAHIEIGKLMTKCNDPVVVYCSGGNTQIIAFVEGKYRIFGETEDIPIGNAFDVLARHMGLKMPGGPKIEELAKNGEWVDLPYVVKGMDLSFSGIVTECIKKFDKGASREIISYSFQETVFAMLTEVTERAMAHTNKNEVLITGGVAASKRLHEMMKIMCKEREGKCYTTPQKFAGDNGVMIAWNALLARKSGQAPCIEKSQIIKEWRTNEVNVTWI